MRHAGTVLELYAVTHVSLCLLPEEYGSHNSNVIQNKLYFKQNDFNYLTLLLQNSANRCTQILNSLGLLFLEARKSGN